MDLLEVINHCAESHRRVKEHSIKYNGHQEECELNSVILVIRKGEPQCGLIIDDCEMKAAFAVAATTFNPDALVLTRDGVSLKNNRRELSTIAVSRDGEILWKLYPYAVVGTMFLGNGFEVPDEMPMLEAERVSGDMQRLMAEAASPPLHMSQFWPDEERAMAEMDTIIAKQLREAPGQFEGAIQQIQLFSQCGTGRQEVLVRSGIPVVFA